jgi:hypothetical protein
MSLTRFVYITVAVAQEIVEALQGLFDDTVKRIEIVMPYTLG